MARINVDLARKIGDVDPRIYGGFIEHLGRCIYGGIYEEGSSLSDAYGFRRDVMEAIRPIQPPVLRWPGGNFVSGYHWVDGIGPTGQRPRRMELAWGGEESNHFGTDEFIQYCRTIDTEPYICVNMGSGSMDEAQAWVEYCNGVGDTYWANLRRQNGHEEPYGVKYWGLGNEMYGGWQIGALPAEEYVRKALEFAKVMKLTDPSIQLVSCGRNGWSDWDRVVLQGLARLVDYHAIHIYTGSDDYYSNVFGPHQAERALRVSAALIEQVRYEQRIEHPIKIAYDEWNVWFRTRNPEARKAGLEEQYTLADALAVATYLNIFIRQCRAVGMANIAQLVNVIAPIFSRPEGLFLQTIYHPLRLYAEHMQGSAIDVHVDCDVYHLTRDQETSPHPHRVADLSPFNLLDVAATLNEDKRTLTLAVVNRDHERDHTTTIDLGDVRAVAEVVAFEVNGDDPTVVNSFEQPNAVRAQERVVNQGLEVRQLKYTFPSHSATLLRMRLQ